MTNGKTVENGKRSRPSKDRPMDKAHRSKGNSSGAAGNSKFKSNSAHPRRNGPCRDLTRRFKIYKDEQKRGGDALLVMDLHDAVKFLRKVGQ